MLSDQQVVADSNDLEMLKRPHLWPDAVQINVRRDMGEPGEMFGICFVFNGYRVRPFKDVSYELVPMSEAPSLRRRRGRGGRRLDGGLMLSYDERGDEQPSGGGPRA